MYLLLICLKSHNCLVELRHLSINDSPLFRIHLFVSVDGDDSFVVMIFNAWNSDLRTWNNANIKNGCSKTKVLLFWFLNTAERILCRQQVQPHYMYNFKLSYNTICSASNKTRNSMDNCSHEHLNISIHIAIVCKTTWYFKLTWYFSSVTKSIVCEPTCRKIQFTTITNKDSLNTVVD